jgi:hypothetical protein
MVVSEELERNASLKMHSDLRAARRPTVTIPSTEYHGHNCESDLRDRELAAK